ncbi:MAG: ABC transporter ATP-binding protein [Chthonomonas sp.]|nr:ABC transporter ATP-binding protein [Chthonomonas sp.]
MADALIQFDHVRKEFLLSHSGAASLKTSLLWWRKRSLEHFVAVDDVSFQVRQGESVALVGRNGAGKSTVLSLVARIYQPTSGTITRRGRMAPLLELGAGFHPDLTGLENLLFNGVIMGLTRKQVRERTEAIVDFAELHSHIDSPVRTYSAGMMARLGFSLAAHVDADLLIVDEVLAVGDAKFEQKCYDRLAEFRQAGGTIFFVSHNPDAVERVADRCLWMEKGKLRADGPATEILSAYRNA